jgi:predicted nucleotidyltransferase
MNAIEFETLIQSNRDSILDIAEKHGARNVRIFGSVARGEADQDSDIDFLVDMSSGHSLLDRIGLKQDLEDLLQCQVDVVTPKVLHEQIRDQVFQEAIVL